MAKKKPKKQPDQEDIFYVGMKDPIEIRRSILESSREIVQYLQRFERFKNSRSEKAEEIAKLKLDIKDIHKLIRKLKSLLPKTKLRTKIHEKPVPLPVVRPMAPQKTLPELTRPKSDLQKLEAELGEIESRLTNLS